MNRNIHLIFCLLTIASATLLSACGDDNDYTPGAEPGTQGKGAYFYAYYVSEKIVEQGETGMIQYQVCRADTSAALDLPLVVEKTAPGITVPASVHFAKGDSTAWFDVNYVGQATGSENRFAIRIGDGYSNPYKEKDGSTRIECNVISGTWENVCDTLIFGCSNTEWPDQGCDLQRLSGRKRLRFTNFLGSGQSLEFSLKSGWVDTDYMKSKGEFNPITNCYDGGTYWYFTNGGNYDAWTPAGSAKSISSIYFWVGDAYTFIDLNWDKDKAEVLKWGGKEYYSDYINHYCLMTGWVIYTDGEAGWVYIYLYLGHEKK